MPKILSYGNFFIRQGSALPVVFDRIKCTRTLYFPANYRYLCILILGSGMPAWYH